MKKIEVASFINKMDDETLNSLLKGVENGTTRVFVGDSDELNQMHQKARFYNTFKMNPKNEEELNPETHFYEQMSKREKLLREKALLDQINHAKKVLKVYRSYSQFIKAHKLVQTINALYSDLQKLSEVQTFSDVYSEDGIDSFVDTIKTIEYKNRAR